MSVIDGVQQVPSLPNQPVGQQPQAPANPEPQPLNPDLAGYPSQEALVRGYRESGAEAVRQRERADAAEQALLSQQATYQTPYAANPRPDIPQQRSDPRSELMGYGIPYDPIDQMIRAEVAQGVQKAFQPVMKSFEARGQVAREYPDFLQFETDVANFLAADPELDQRYKRMFEADPAGAMEFAFMKFGESRRKDFGATEPAPEGASHAAIPSSRAGDARRPEAANAPINELWNRYQQTGNSADAQKYAKARLRNVITDDFLNA